MRAIDQAYQPEPVLRGRFEDLDISQLLSVLQLGRQFFTLEVYDAAGDCTGVVSVKAGRIVSASVDGYTGLSAVRRLLTQHDGTGYRVLRLPSDAAIDSEPLGTIAAITRAIAESEAEDNSDDAPKPISEAEERSGTFKRLRILEGSLEDFELTHVLRVLSTSRQHFELQVRDEASGKVGVIEVKSGMVVAARTATLTGLPAAHALLGANRGMFVAIRRVHDALDRPALVSVSELLQPKAASAADDASSDEMADTQEETQALALSRIVERDAPDDVDVASKAIPVMDGKLGELDVQSILQVAGASRQYTCVHIFDDLRRPLGAVHLMAGQVVRAKAQDVTGVPALRRLLHCPRDFSFLVLRYASAPEGTSSIGSIASVLKLAAAPAAPQLDEAQPDEPKPSFARARRNDSANGWLGGAALGAGFVLLGGIAAALLLRPPALSTSTSAISVPPANELRPAPPPPLERPPAAREEPPARPEAESDTTHVADDVEPQPASASSAMSRATIASLQAGLQQLGYATGPIDGVIGPRTAAAIRAFQYAEHLSADGTISAATRAVLLRRISEP